MRSSGKKSVMDNPTIVDKPAFVPLVKLFHYLNSSEINSVHWVVKATQKPLIRNFLVFINHLGNGWLYLLVVIALVVMQGRSSWQVLLAAGLSTLLAHCIYPAIKNRVQRVRPCYYDPSLDLSVKTLDHYSFPSGHVMTATTFGIPLLIMLPAFSSIILITYLLILLARIALGHHYPSDIVCGALLGISISFPICLYVVY